MKYPRLFFHTPSFFHINISFTLTSVGFRILSYFKRLQFLFPPEISVFLTRGRVLNFQNFGPNCNFKKRKIKPGSFVGFPAKTKFLQDRFESVPLLRNYKTIEQCSLEYDPKRGASIDPHVDDCWIWGERIVTVNLLSDTVLVLTKYKGEDNRYNLELAPNIPNGAEDISVRIPMPRKSLIVLYGDARYNWEHCILREDVKSRRICLAYREFTPPYLLGGDHEMEGKEILKIAENFWE